MEGFYSAKGEYQQAVSVPGSAEWLWFLSALANIGEEMCWFGFCCSRMNFQWHFPSAYMHVCTQSGVENNQLLPAMFEAETCSQLHL